MEVLNKYYPCSYYPFQIPLMGKSKGISNFDLDVLILAWSLNQCCIEPNCWASQGSHAYFRCVVHNVGNQTVSASVSYSRPYLQVSVFMAKVNSSAQL